MNVIKTLKLSFQMLKKDKWIFVFSLIPILIGFLFYSFIGAYLYTDFLTMGSQWVEEKVTNDTFGPFLVYLMVTLLTVSFYFIVSWTFMLMISLISSPFSDVISKRVEKAYLGEDADTLMESLNYIGRGFISSLYNELKKITFILIVTLISFLLSFIPLMVPLSAVLSSYLMAASFLDYSWSRKKMSIGSCVADVKKGFIFYALSGFLFLIIVSVPVLNLCVIPIAVIYFTIAHTQRSLSV